MALQLVYTSAPKLLDAGRSGFGIVAKSKSLPPLAANAIERFSKFANMQGTDRSRIVMAHRKVTIGSSRLHVLSRIRDSGSDHTGRTNHIAHHLIFSPLEIRQAAAQGLTPADIFAQFVWLNRWDGAPKAFDTSENVPISNFSPHFSAANRAAWSAATGEPLHSRLLAGSAAPKSGVLVFPLGTEMLPLLGEALAECQNPWEKTFTTSLEPTDELAELDWVLAAQSDKLVLSRVSSRTIFDISRPIDLPVPTEAPQPIPDAIATREPQIAPPTARQYSPPPSGQTHSPLQVRVKPAQGNARSARGSHPTTTGGSRNETPWRLIASGIAALVILVAVALIFLQKREADRKDSLAAKTPEENNETVANRENEKKKKVKETELIKKLTTAGELNAKAKTIAELIINDSSLENLPNEITNTQKALISLGETPLEATSEDLKKELDAFKTHENLIKHESELPEGSLSKNLIGIINSMESLLKADNSKNAKDWTTSLRELEKKLSSSSLFTEPSWIDDAKIIRIVHILWEWKYNKLAVKFSAASSDSAFDELKSFMDCRNDPEIVDEIISDLQLRGINSRMQKNEGVTYAAYVEKLKAKDVNLPIEFLLHDQAIVDDGKPTSKEESKTAAKPMPESDPKPPAQDASKFKDEEWCIIDPNKNGSFRIELPDSKIMQAIINEQNENEKIHFKFKSGVRSEIGFNSEIIIKDGGISPIEKTFDKAQDESLTIEFKDVKLHIYFKKWQVGAGEEKKILSGSFKSVASTTGGAASYTLHLVGLDLAQLEELRSKTIPEAKLVWHLKKAGELKVITSGDIQGDAKTLAIEDFAPSGKEIPAPTTHPSEKILNAFKTAISETEKEAAKKIINEKGPNKTLDVTTEIKFHEEAWKEKGWGIISKDQKTIEWLQGRYNLLHTGSDTVNINSISRISGDNQKDDVKLLMKILKNPTEEKICKPEFHVPLEFSVRIKVGDKFINTKTFTIELKK